MITMAVNTFCWWIFVAFMTGIVFTTFLFNRRMKKLHMDLCALQLWLTTMHPEYNFDTHTIDET